MANFGQMLSDPLTQALITSGTSGKPFGESLQEANRSAAANALMQAQAGEYEHKRRMRELMQMAGSKLDLPDELRGLPIDVALQLKGQMDKQRMNQMMMDMIQQSGGGAGQAGGGSDRLRSLALMAGQNPALEPLFELEMKNYEAAQQEQVAQSETYEGQSKLADVVKQIKGYYDDLKEMDAVASSDKSPLQNMKTYLKRTMPGEVVGKAMGSKEQELVEKIKNTRPIIARAIKEATGMTGQEMNSNVELQLMLDSITDPSATYDANIERLMTIDSQYSGGLAFGGKAGDGDASEFAPGDIVEDANGNRFMIDDNGELQPYE